MSSYVHVNKKRYIPLIQLQYQTQVSAASSTSQSGEDFDEEEDDDGYYQDDDDYDVDEDMGFGNEVKAKETYATQMQNFVTMSLVSVLANVKGSITFC